MVRIKLLILTSLFLFFGVGSVFAGDAPILLSPANNTTVISSKVQWLTPSYSLYTEGSYYMVQVDDQQTFANPEKNNIYLKNNSYSPQLNPGTWYWRVKAKDANGAWSNWSNAWSFTLGDSTPSPTPTPTSIPSPSPTPTFTVTPTPSPTATPVSITISNVPSQINSDQSFNVSVNTSSNNPNIYFKGAFKKPDGSNYFGLTRVSGDWIKNSSNFANQYQGSGNFDLEIKPDIDDSGYIGSGDYLFKVAGYSAEGNLNWSNEATVNIQSVNIEIPTTPEPEPGSTPQTSLLPKAPVPKLAIKFSSPKQYKIASVAAVATKSASVSSATKVINDQQFNPLKIIGAILIIAGLSIPIFFFIKLKIKSGTS